MKFNTNIFFLFAVLLSPSCDEGNESSQGKDFTSKVDVNTAQQKTHSYAFFNKEKKPLTSRFEMLPVNSVHPKGWLYDIMKEDVTTGFVAHLDKLAPNVLQNDELYHKDRRNSIEDRPSVGNQVLTGADWEISMQWWNSESLGNWWDAYVRNAFLTQDEKAMQRSHEIVDYLLASQDEDGYIGIYGEKMRYQHKGSNGELWSKTTAFRMLLAYYELTGKLKVLEAIERSMSNLMVHYNQEAKSPFQLEKAFGGVTHGLMLTDVCETLYRITKKQKYSDYAVFLYQNFSEYPINRAFNDAAYGYLMERDSLFESHSVHTYEHLRSVIQAYYATGYPELETAYKNALHKLSHCILPSGAGFGNEWLSKQTAEPSTTAAEVCGMVELSHFYTSALQKTGEIHFGDDLEKLTFNALLGSRNENGTGITYCKTDNCSQLSQKAPQHNFEETDRRYKYSPAHTDVAVCCNPNYGRHFPYYVSSMWMKVSDGLAAVLYGPSELNTIIDNTKITIEQVTNYPFEDEIVLKISTSQPIEFSLYFRKPNWVKSMNLQAEEATSSLENGFYKIKKQWQSGDVVRLHFENDIQAKTHFSDEIYFQKGPLVFAYPIAHKVENTKDYDLEGFYDYNCILTDTVFKKLILSKEQLQSFKIIPANPSAQKDFWRTNSVQLSGKVMDSNTEKTVDVQLVPMGSTVLRQVTFLSQ